MPSLGGGGAERVMSTLAKSFVDQGLSVDLVLCRTDGPYRKDLPPQVNIVDLNASRVILSLSKLAGYLRRVRPQALLSTLDHANVIAILARRVSGASTRIIVRVATTVSVASVNDRQLLGRFMPSLIRLFYPWADGVVAVSKGVAEDISKILRNDSIPVRVIYNPVITDDFFSKASESVSHPFYKCNDEPVVLGVGRLVGNKGFQDLIRAFALVNQQRRSRLIILGEGGERAALQALINELGIADRADLVGFVDNPLAYMSRSNVFVLSSEYEGLPNSLIQAMALGTPVVSTDCQSGPSEILDGGRLGELVPVGDHAAMAKSILGCILGSRLQKRQTAVWDKYSAKMVSGEYLRLLKGDDFA